VSTPPSGKPDFPDSLTSDRLLMRAPRPGDGQAVHAAIMESLPQLQRWMSWASPAPSLEEVEEVQAQARRDFIARRDLRLLLFSQADGSFVGVSGLQPIDWSVPRFEIGYWVRTSQTGRGFATEAAARICRFALEELGAQRVEIWCEAENLASAAVARRAGFELEARLARSRRNLVGDVTDSLCFVRLPAPDPSPIP
jgi:ribosomal-protein-serine acetyltransferase